MRKLFYLSFVSVLAICLTGCSNKKKMNCSIIDTQDGLKTEQIVKISYKKEKPVKYSMEVTVNLDKEYNEYIDSMIEQYEGEFSDYKNANGVSINSKKNKSGFKVNFEVDLNKVDADIKKELELDEKTNYSDLKKEFEKQGYVCK